MKTSIQKWGNSLALRIPKAFADSIGIDAGTLVELGLEDARLVISVVPSIAFGLDAAMSDERREEWRASTWLVVLNLRVPALEPQSVQWTVFDEDPLPRFGSEVEARLGWVEDPESPIARRTLGNVCWNLLFRPITGDAIHMLTPGWKTMFNPPTIKDRLWLVTKGVELEGRLIAWSVPLSPRAGRQDEVELNEENATDLLPLVDQAIG